MPLLRSTARQLANFLFRQFQELEKQCLYYGPLLDNFLLRQSQELEKQCLYYGPLLDNLPTFS